MRSSLMQDRHTVREQLDRFRRGGATWDELLDFAATFEAWGDCDTTGPWLVVVEAWSEGSLTEDQLGALYRSARHLGADADTTTIDLTAESESPRRDPR